MADALGDPSVGGFEVTALQNESAQAIRFAVEDFFADRAPEHLLLLHYSCHGLKNAAGELFLGRRPRTCLACPGSCAASARSWLRATISTYVLISIVATVPALTVGSSMPVFLTSLGGNLLVAGAGLLTQKSYRRPDPATSAVLAAGFMLLVVNQFLTDQYGPSEATYTRGFALLLPIVAAALVLFSTTTGDRVMVGAAASYLLLFVVAALYPMAVDQVPTYFAAAPRGHLVLLAALLLGVRRRESLISP